MEAATQSIQSLRKQILDTEAQLASLKVQLEKTEAKISLGSLSLDDESTNEKGDENSFANKLKDINGTKWPLSAEEYKRYGRQMIVPSVGLQGISHSKSVIFKTH